MSFLSKLIDDLRNQPQSMTSNNHQQVNNIYKYIRSISIFSTLIPNKLVSFDGKYPHWMTDTLNEKRKWNAQIMLKLKLTIYTYNIMMYVTFEALLQLEFPSLFQTENNSFSIN